MRPIQEIDYRIQGYAKEKIYDAKGDVSEVRYYQNYDNGTQTFSGLKVKETRSTDRDVTLGIPHTHTVNIEWYKADEVTVIASKTLVKPINQYDGMAMNELSRKRLVEKGQGYLLQQIGLDNTKEFGSDVSVQRAEYIAGTRQPLIDAINNSVRAYMTAPIKATLVAILDIDY